MFENMRKTLRKNNHNILSVKEYIEKNSHLHFTLDDLAEMSGLSRYFFCRIFKKLTGESPINYVNRCRINAVKRLLIETEKSVKEIMLTCGFDNESHFFRLFKSQVKLSPSMFRESNRRWIT
jgi:AraC-like DNA-binding protein